MVNGFIKNQKRYIISERVKKIHAMKKNSGEIFQPLQVNAITGQYYLQIPEIIVNDLSWYEDTEISIKIESDEVVLSERKGD